MLLVQGTKSPRVNHPFSLENRVTGTKIWSLRLVPRFQTMSEFVGQFAGTCPLNLCWSLRVNCSWYKSLRLNEMKPIVNQYFRSHNPLRNPFDMSMNLFLLKALFKWLLFFLLWMSNRIRNSRRKKRFRNCK